MNGKISAEWTMVCHKDYLLLIKITKHNSFQYGQALHDICTLSAT